MMRSPFPSLSFYFILFLIYFSLDSVSCHSDNVPSGQVTFSSHAPFLNSNNDCFSKSDFQFAFNTSAGYVKTHDGAIVLPYPPEKENYISIPRGHTRVAFSIWNIKLRRYMQWSEFNSVHHRKSHLLFISDDLETFGHVHAEDFWPSPNPEDTVFNTVFDFRRAKHWHLRFEIDVAAQVCHHASSHPMRNHHSSQIGHNQPHSNPYSNTHSMHKRNVGMMMPMENKDTSIPLHSEIKVCFHGAPDATLVAKTPKKLVSKEIVYGFPIHENGTHRSPIPLAQVQSHLKASSNPRVIFHSSSAVYQFFSPRLGSTFSLNTCAPIFFFVAKHRSPQLHPVIDLSLLLGGVGHITLVHETTHSFVHLHAQAFTPDQIPQDIRESTMSLLKEKSTFDISSLSSLSFSQLTKRKTVPSPIHLCQEGAHHQHPQHHHMNTTATSSIGPWIGFPLKLSKKGWWKMMIQVQHKEKMIVPSFWIEVV